jgi:TRAP-type mannitol/chloroaromatic compound transport system substrate-binding protein
VVRTLAAAAACALLAAGAGAERAAGRAEGELGGGRAPAERDAERPAKLRLQAGFPFAQPVTGEMIVHFRDQVAAAGRDDLRLHVYDAGRLVPTLQIFDAVSAGRLDGGFSWPGYWMGKIPAATLFAAVPFGPEATEYLAWIHQGGGLELWRRLYAAHDLVPVPCGVIESEASGWFRRPIEGPEDLVGLKIRYAGLAGRVLQKLGASITMLASGDIFVALERGVLDATEYSMPAVDRSLGFYKVAKHYYFPGWHQPASILELMVHKPRWDALGPARRASLEAACGATTVWGLTRGLAIQGEALAFFESQGVTLHQWPPALMQAFRDKAAEVIEESAASDRDFAEVWRSLQDFRARTAAWRAIATP